MELKVACIQVLLSEQDLSTKRNAFLMLCQHDQSRAISYLLGQLDNVAMWGDILQMAVLELIRKASLVYARDQTLCPTWINPIIQSDIFTGESAENAALDKHSLV